MELPPLVRHFTHPNHPLKLISDNREFVCDGCRTPGSKTRYRCIDCDFDLHKCCATSPLTMSSFLHPNHQLTLLNTAKPLYNPRSNFARRLCDVCGELIGGLFYTCRPCNFDLHPICAQLSEQLQHPYDNEHMLKFQKPSSGWCMVCRTECSVWCYSCSVCRLDIHLKCASAHALPLPGNSPNPCQGAAPTPNDIHSGRIPDHFSYDNGPPPPSRPPPSPFSCIYANSPIDFGSAPNSATPYVSPARLSLYSVNQNNAVVPRRKNSSDMIKDFVVDVVQNVTANAISNTISSMLPGNFASTDGSYDSTSIDGTFDVSNIEF